MPIRRYTLSASRRHEVHAVERVRTLCGLYLNFAGDPRETIEPINCPSCLAAVRGREGEGRQRSLPLPAAEADRVIATVQEYGRYLRAHRFNAADKTLLEIVRLVRGDYAELAAASALETLSLSESNPLRGGVAAAPTDSPGAPGSARAAG